MDHAHDMTPVDGPWAGGWAIAALAGLFAVAVAKGIGDVGTAPAALLGAMTFLVHGVLLGTGGIELPPAHGGDHDHGPAHH
jgi:hypothetical protein